VTTLSTKPDKRHTFDLNSSVTVPATIVDLLCTGQNLSPFDRGLSTRVADVTININKITMTDGKMHIHRQIGWTVGDNDGTSAICKFTKTFVSGARFNFKDTIGTLTYGSLETDDYVALRKLFWCYDDMERTLPLVKFFGEVLLKLFGIIRVSNYIFWNYNCGQFLFKSSSVGEPVALGDVDCSQMSTLGEFLRFRLCRHVSKADLAAKLQEHYPE